MACFSSGAKLCLNLKEHVLLRHVGQPLERALLGLGVQERVEEMRFALRYERQVRDARLRY